MEAEKAKEERALSPEGFAVFWLLQREGIGEAEAVARRVAEAFRQYPHWERSDTQQRNLRIALFRVLLSAGVDPVVGFASLGRLTFNRALLSQPAAFRTEVIVHELLHLKIPNHGAVFRSLLRAYLAGSRVSLTPGPSPAGRGEAFCEKK